MTRSYVASAQTVHLIGSALPLQEMDNHRGFKNLDGFHTSMVPLGNLAEFRRVGKHTFENDIHTRRHSAKPGSRPHATCDKISAQIN